MVKIMNDDYKLIFDKYQVMRTKYTQKELVNIVGLARDTLRKLEKANDGLNLSDTTVDKIEKAYRKFKANDKQFNIPSDNYAETLLSAQQVLVLVSSKLLIQDTMKYLDISSQTLQSIRDGKRRVKYSTLVRVINAYAHDDFVGKQSVFSLTKRQGFLVPKSVAKILFEQKLSATHIQPEKYLEFLTQTVDLISEWLYRQHEPENIILSVGMFLRNKTTLIIAD